MTAELPKKIHPKTGLDEKDNFRDFYTYRFFCKNCTTCNLRYIPKGVYVAECEVECEKCGCEV